jgi:LEA14-like dessication related protein
MLMLKRLPVLALVLLAACSVFNPKFTKPTLSVVSIEMLHGNLLQQDFQVKFRIQNPNDRALPVKGLHADLTVGGEPFATGSSQKSFIVPALGDTEFDMMITANMALGLLKLANNMDKQSDAIAYDLNGVVTVDLPFVGDVPFHQDGSFSLGSKQ